MVSQKTKPNRSAKKPFGPIDSTANTFKHPSNCNVINGGKRCSKIGLIINHTGNMQINEEPEWMDWEETDELEVSEPMDWTLAADYGDNEMPKPEECDKENRNTQNSSAPAQADNFKTRSPFSGRNSQVKPNHLSDYQRNTLPGTSKQRPVDESEQNTRFPRKSEREHGPECIVAAKKCYNEGLSFYRSSKFEEASQCFEKAIEISCEDESLKEDSSYAELLVETFIRLADVSFDRKEFLKSASYYNSAAIKQYDIAKKSVLTRWANDINATEEELHDINAEKRILIGLGLTKALLKTDSLFQATSTLKTLEAAISAQTRKIYSVPKLEEKLSELKELIRLELHSDAEAADALAAERDYKAAAEKCKRFIEQCSLFTEFWLSVISNMDAERASLAEHQLKLDRYNYWFQKVSENKNHYETLGLEFTASDKDINKAFRRLSLKYHPDKTRKEETAVQFREASESKEALLKMLESFGV